MKKVCRAIVFFAAAFLASCGGVSGSRWFSGDVELTFEDSTWMLFDSAGKKGWRGEFREREGFLALSVDETYDSSSESWRTADEKREYIVTINGHKLYLDRQNGEKPTVFLKE